MWKNYITPTQNELAWTRIPWLSSFGEGMIQADAQQKPVLLWVMNGHPLGCTGAKLTTSLLYELERRQGRYGLVTMCVGGGMGAAGIFERLS